jgi:hypothetical protein
VSRHWWVVWLISDFLVDVRRVKVRLCEAVFICYFMPKLICTFGSLHVMHPIFFELYKIRLVDFWTASQQKKWLYSFRIPVIEEAFEFLYLGNERTCPHWFTSLVINFRMTLVRIRSCTVVAVYNCGSGRPCCSGGPLFIHFTNHLQRRGVFGGGIIFSPTNRTYLYII